MLLEGRVAVVAGIGPGMGRDIALALAREGADLVLGARREEGLKRVAARVEERGRRAVWRPTDIAEQEQCEALAALAVETFGRVDVLVNNAFVQPPIETIEENSIQTWREAFEVNVFGTVQMTKAVIPVMKEQGSGSIVFINSMSMRRIQPMFGPYAATKSALYSTAKVLARELGRYGIRVNTVVPGYIAGKSLDFYFEMLAKEQGRSAQEVYDEVAAETSLGRLPTSAEIADAVVFFASDLSRVVTGQALDVNAGHWLE